MEASGPEAELFALAEKAESAEKAFHNALLCRNEAQIAYLRDPSISRLSTNLPALQEGAVPVMFALLDARSMTCG